LISTACQCKILKSKITRLYFYQAWLWNSWERSS